MQAILKNCRAARGALALLPLVMLGIASPAWSGTKMQPASGPKLRHVADVPEDYLGRTFTYKVRISTQERWMYRNGDYFFLFVQDAEGNKHPNRGYTPDGTINLIRFILPKQEGLKLIERLDPSQMYEARIRFTVERQRALVGQRWDYLARISLVEVP
jgi:hypothetical protein